MFVLSPQPRPLNCQARWWKDCDVGRLTTNPFEAKCELISLTEDWNEKTAQRRPPEPERNAAAGPFANVNASSFHNKRGF